MTASTITYKTTALIINRTTRLLGNVVKTLSYPFHAVFPTLRFTIPEYSPAKIKPKHNLQIPRVIWQTNYSNRVSLPVYCNYLFNRLMSLDFDYRYVSTEAREAYIKANADERVFHAYSQLTDGAAQADFWRMLTLEREGGIYMDIDGQLVLPLNKLLTPKLSELVVIRRDQYSNFFLASIPHNWFLADTLELIVQNIENRKIDGGVFVMTGPTNLNNAIGTRPVNGRSDKYTCIQGTFTNEHFQYIDKKRGKWNHTKNEDLLKK